MDALPAPSSSRPPRTTDGSSTCGSGLSPEDAESWTQLQSLAQAAVQPWVFAIAVAVMTAAVVVLLWLGKAGAVAEVDSAELLVPVVPMTVQADPQR